jgi:TM2 domain-containing membrane protein YozV
MNVARGRYPLAEANPSNARFWAPAEVDGLPIQSAGQDPQPVDSEGRFVPRPDRSLSTLQWLAISPLGLLGADHFYLRSPGTALAKMLTLGGFGFWYLWDAVQVAAESDRVLNYGMTGLFDMFQGVGQGMLYKGGSVYGQNTSFSAYLFSAIFGFLGLDMMVLGRFHKAIHKLLIAILSILIFSGIGASAQAGTLGSFGGVMLILLALCVIYPLSGVVALWFSDLAKLFGDPKDLMRQGLPVSPLAIQGLTWWERLFTDSEGNPDEGYEADFALLKDQFGFGKEGVSAREMMGRFWIGWNGQETFNPQADKKGYVMFPLLRILWRVVQLFFIAIKDGIIAIVGIFTGRTAAGLAAKAASAAGVPGADLAANLAAGKIPTNVGGLASMAAKTAGIANPLAAAQQAATQAMANPLAAAQQAATQAMANPLAEVAQQTLQAVGKQGGGARAESLSTESQVLGASVIALILGGAVKIAVDTLVAE